MNVVPIPVGLIDEIDLPRELDTDYVEMIAASMADRDQDAPIHVMPANGHGRYRLIAGRHRLAALRKLGRPTIAAIIFEGTEIDARLLQVDENLVRRELSPLDRGMFLKLRKDLFEEKSLRQKTTQDIDNANGAVLALTEDFVRTVGKKLRISRRDVFRGLARAGLPEDVRQRIATTHLAMNGAALDALVRLGDADRQRRAVSLVLDEGRKLADALRAARDLPPVSVPAATDLFDEHLALWKRMNAALRERVRQHVNAKPSRARGKRAG